MDARDPQRGGMNWRAQQIQFAESRKKGRSGRAAARENSDDDLDESSFRMPNFSDMTGYGEETPEVPVASMDTHLSQSNMGFKLMAKMGWTQGQGLGKNSEGRVDPVRIVHKSDNLGVGKSEEMKKYDKESTARRKALESERIAEETAEERATRESQAQRSEAIKEEIKSVTSAFYCAICDKQYKKVAEYDTHLSSYDHHHRKRFKEMRDMSKKGTLPGTGSAKRKREDKERAREERELKRLQDAVVSQNRGKDAEPSVDRPTTSDTVTEPENALAATSSSHTGINSGIGKELLKETLPDPAPTDEFKANNILAEVKPANKWSTIDPVPVHKAEEDVDVRSAFVPVVDQAAKSSMSAEDNESPASERQPTSSNASKTGTKLKFGMGVNKPTSGLKFSFGKKS
ncbi:hypothetical protein DFS34DRAFT_598593 [Phlyctochytrium arcticum]|nr:hypothetical protein DFS34DRAFT_598593 [Phlyctochytrium arcticum]